jgi:hypothetical protein
MSGWLIAAIVVGGILALIGLTVVVVVVWNTIYLKIHGY